MSLTVITVIADYTTGGGYAGTQPIPGKISFTPSAQLVDTVDHIIIPAVPIPLPLAAGQGSVELVCTDNANLSPSGWYWTVTQQVGTATISWPILLPHTLGASVNLDALAPVSPGPAVSTLYGVLAAPNTNTWASTQIFNGPVTLNDGLTLSAPLTAADLPAASTTAQGAVVLDGTATDIQPLGTQAAGNLGKSADAGHVHAMPRLDQVGAPTNPVAFNGQKATGGAPGVANTDFATVGQLPTALPPNGTASGDLSGSYPSPSVAKVNGTAVPSGPAVGTSLLATSGSAAAWLPGGPVFNARAYGALGNGKKVTDAAITATANTLTSSTANFAMTDVGKTVMIVGAGASGLPLVTTISGFTNATTVTLTATATTTVSGATAWYGTDDSTALTAAHNAALNSATGGTVYYPGAIYLTLAALPCTNTTGTVLRVTGDNARSTVLVAPSSHALDLGGNYVKGGFEIDHLAIVAYGGDCVHNANLNQAYIHHANFDQYNPGYSVFSMTTTGSLILLTVDQCNSSVWTPNGSSRTVDAWTLVTNIGSGLANCTWQRVNFQNYCASSGGKPDNAKYQVRLQATGSSGHHNTHQHNAFRDCYFEQCFGGEIISLSGGALTIDGCRTWDIYNSTQFGNQACGNNLIYIGEDPNGVIPSWRTTITNHGRDTTASGVNGTSLWDVYLESTTLETTMIGVETRAVPGTPTPFYVNLNGSDIVSIGHQWSSAGNQNSTTTFSNNTGASILLTDGNVSFSGSLIGASTPNIPLPSDHGLISWAFDPANIAGTSAVTVGALYLSAMFIRSATTISNIVLAYGTTTGTGLSNCYVGLYSSAGVLLSGSADQSSSWMTAAGASGGPKTAALTSAQAVAPGYYWAAFMIGAATVSPVWGRGGNNPIGLMNLGDSLNTRFGELSTASTPAAPFTTLPASFTPSSANIVIPGAPFWAAVK